MIGQIFEKDGKRYIVPMKDIFYYAKLNSITNDTSAYTNSLKKSLQYKIGLQNRTEDTSKFRTGLLSAGGNSNNNVIIPFFMVWIICCF